MTVYLTWKSLAADGTASVSNSEASDATCGSGTFLETPIPGFAIKSLGTSLAAVPSALGVGGQTDVTLAVTNHTTGAHTVTPGTLSQNPGTVLSCPAAPAAQSISAGASAYFVWTCNAAASGTEALTAAASGAGVTGPDATGSATVGDLTATMAVTPTTVIDGEMVTVKLTVKNNGSSPVHDVTPSDPPTTLGTAATKTELSGPLPASVSSLSAGQSVAFRWTYEIGGSVGQDYAFEGYATADGGSLTTNTATSEYGRISEYSVSASPTTVYTSGTDQAIAFTVVNNGGYNVDRIAIEPDDATGWAIEDRNEPYWWSQDTSGWTPTGTLSTVETIFTAPTEGDQIATGGGQKTFTVLYRSTPGTEVVTNFLVAVRNVNGGSAVVSAAVSVVDEPTPAERPPDVDYFTGAALNGEVDLYWGNPVNHDGVLILRSAAAPTGWCVAASPADGLSYSTGERLCDAPDPIVDVAYFDSASYVTSTLDTGVTSDGSGYYYKIHNHDADLLYSDGAVPSSNGLNLKPTDCVDPNPCWAWQYGLGGAAISAPPSVMPGDAVYANTNTDLVAGISASLGTQLWTPYTVTGTIQNRYAVVPVTISSVEREVIFTATDGGFAYGIDSDNGSLVWSQDVKGGDPDIGVVAAPAVQINEYSSATFQSTYTGSESVVFIATSHASDRTANTVQARKASDGTLLWTFDPDTALSVPMDAVSGVPLVDYDNDRLYFSSGDGGAGQDTAWAISTIDGSLVWRQAYGDSTFSLAPNSDYSRFYFGNEAGTLYALNSTTGAAIWTWKPSDETGFDASYDTGFVRSAWRDFMPGYIDRVYVSTRDGANDGRVWALSDGGASASVVWSYAVAAPSFPLPLAYAAVDYSLYVGSSDGVLYELNIADGVLTGTSPSFSSGTVGDPALDQSNLRLIVGTEQGNVFSVDGPFHTP